jgi:hypothetical protein
MAFQPFITDATAEPVSELLHWMYKLHDTPWDEITAVKKFDKRGRAVGGIRQERITLGMSLIIVC